MAMTILFIFSLLLAGRVAADETPYYGSDKYNRAELGHFVSQTFQSNPQVTAVPVVNFMKPFSNCDDGSFLFLALRGYATKSTPMILDVTGSPVWASTKEYGQVYNLQVQQYRGDHYLTFWGGNDAVGGHGIGEYFMLDQHYRERYRVKAANDLGADLHSFTITKENTALITVYQAILADITDMIPGQEPGYIWDSIFQEIDIETGEAVFQWRAYEHISVRNSYMDVNDASERDPWDVYHINSVEKDVHGNYLVSARFLRAVLYIDGRTGDVLWQLGGKDNSFIDLSDGRATTFMGQHDAHWLDGQQYITFFDNRADWEHKADKQSAGTRIKIDLERMTAELDATFVDPYYDISSSSQGSYQTLPNGNVVLGYGFNAVMSEFSPDGDLLCDAYFQPAATFTSGDVQTYRALKYNWTAYPDSDPDLVFSSDGKLYMSWNGATEIDSWLLEGSDDFGLDSEDFAKRRTNARTVDDVVILPSQGFETVHEFFYSDELGRFLRAIALDRDGTPLGASNIVDTQNPTPPRIKIDGEIVEQEIDETPDINNNKGVKDKALLVGIGLGAALTIILIVTIAFGRRCVLAPIAKYHQLRNFDDEDKMAEQGASTISRDQLTDYLLPSRWKRRTTTFDDFANQGLLSADASAQLNALVPEQSRYDSLPPHERWRSRA